MKKRIPVGLKDYEKLRNENYYVVDKTLMIKDFLERGNEVTLITRPRRFGKTINMSMMAEFFDITKNSKKLFKNTKIINTEYVSEINQYPTVFISFADAKGDKDIVTKHIKSYFRSLYNDYDFIFKNLTRLETYDYETIIHGLTNEKIELKHISDSLAFLMRILEKYYNKKVMVFIDEYDTPFIEAHLGGFYEEIRDGLSSMLHNALKTSTSLQYAMMTGIQRVAKENIFSDLNNLVVCTVKDPEYAQYFGFTEEEVCLQCEQQDMEYAEVKRWYDGYLMDGTHIYNPKSISDAMHNRKFKSYWTRTETYEALRVYIDMNFDGLKDAVIAMTCGERCEINPDKFQNDMTTFQSKDDVLTLLVHLGYLTFDRKKNEVFIPNQEITQEFMNAVEEPGWNGLAAALSRSEELLE